jgi:hypothetical protein
MSLLHLVVLLVLLLIVCALPGVAGEWCRTPLAKWQEAQTLDACTEGAVLDGLPAVIPPGGRWPVPVPVPPYGRWQEEAEGVTASGLTHCWSTMLMPGTRNGAVIDTRFTVTRSSGAARQMPGGCMRWGFHWGENLPGWDVGVVFGYQDPLNFYRLQLSAARGELALWDATGGFLQIIPCRVALNAPHDLQVRWREGHISAVLDGQTVMDYWDRTLPYARGKVGLAVWKSDVRFTQFAAAKVDGPRETAPAHTPDFRFVPANDLLDGHPGFYLAPQQGLILFDGYEPISYFFKSKGADGRLIHEAVKLKPGWRPVYYNYIGPRLQLQGQPDWWPTLEGTLPEAFTVTQTGATLAFTFKVRSPGNTGITDHACTVRYDAKRDVYRYEFASRLQVTADCTGYDFEVSDPLTYNNRTPGPEVVHRWNPAGHRWWVSQGVNDVWQRMPIADDWSGLIANTPAKWDASLDFLYPDPVACPAFEMTIGWPQAKGMQRAMGQCLWGYDYHHRALPSGTLKAGDVRTWTLAFTALPPKEAEPLFAKSAIPAQFQQQAQTVFLPFDPTGTTFAATTTLADPSTTMCWSNGIRDTAVGHNDNFSLRIDGPGKAKLTLYQYMIEQHVPRWQIHGWIKTRDIAGAATLRVKYSYGKEYVRKGDTGEETFTLAGPGTNDWTAFSVVTTVPRVQDCTDITFELNGTGQAWIDDVGITALSK